MWVEVCVRGNDHAAGRDEQIETYLADRSELEFSHGICPSCYARLYPEGHDEG